MTASEWLKKYRTRLAGLAATLAIDCPTIVVGMGDRYKTEEARGRRVETLEDLGKNIDLTLGEMLADARTVPPEPPKPMPEVRPEMKGPVQITKPAGPLNGAKPVTTERKANA